MGHDLLDILVVGTGLPENGVRQELLELINRNGKTPDALTMDDLREILADYLQDVLLAARDHHQKIT